MKFQNSPLTWSRLLQKCRHKTTTTSSQRSNWMKVLLVAHGWLRKLIFWYLRYHVDSSPLLMRGRWVNWASFGSSIGAIFADSGQTFGSFSRTLRVFLAYSYPDFSNLNMEINILVSPFIILDTKQHIKHEKTH